MFEKNYIQHLQLFLVLLKFYMHKICLYEVLIRFAPIINQIKFQLLIE